MICSPLPACVSEALASVKVERKASVTGDDLDTPYNISLAVDYLTHRAPLAVEGDGGDATTYTVAAAVRDYGISEDCCLGMMEEIWNERCSPPWSQEELEGKVAHAYEYAQNEAGNRGVPKEQSDEWIRLAREAREKYGTPDKDAVSEKANNPWAGLWPDEFEGMPEPTFWDPAKVLPRTPGGATVIIYGEFGAHKTNTTLTMVLDCVLNAGAKAVFAAGEGAYGLGKKRVPAHCKARGIKTADLRGKFRIVAGVPLLADKAQVQAFIDAQEELRPEIVVLDTFATAIAGVDENSSEAAQFLTGNGTVGWIRKAYDALVILPAHKGKTPGKGIRGNSGFGGNADVVIACDADKGAGVVKLTVEKMRDGEDGHSLYFAVEKDGVPVPVRITKEDYEARRGKAAPVDEDAGIRLTVRIALEAAGADRFMAGLSDKVLAERLCGEEPTPDTEEWRQWLSAVEKRRASLRSARCHDRAWTRGLVSEEVTHEGGKLQWRWWYPGQQSEE